MVNENDGEKQNKIEQLRYVGQNTAVRFFNPDNSEDVERLMRIILEPEVQKWILDGEDMNYEDVQRWAGQKGYKKQEETLFAITGAKNYVDNDEVGEVQGFVNCYSLEENVRERMIGSKVVEGDRKIMEMSYARDPQAKPGQIASGILQVCFVLNKLYGYDEAANQPDLDIVAFIGPLNVASIKVIERAGFEKKADIEYEEDKGLTTYGCYKLNWEKAQEILHREAEKIPLSFK